VHHQERLRLPCEDHGVFVSTVDIETPRGLLPLDDAPFADFAEATDATTPLPRVAFAAAHVVMRDTYGNVPHREDAPGSSEDIAAHLDWDATMGIRRKIGGHGLGIAEAMDTAQRFSLGWNGARELIRRTGELDLSAGFCAGAGTDQVSSITDANQLVSAVGEQVEYIRSHGGIPVILPMPWLTRHQAGPEEYVRVYGEIIRHAPENCPLIIHWLGEMFLPELAGYFPEDSFQRIMRIDPGKVRGAKISLLDHDLEVRLRRDLLQRDQIMLTGDDFHFGALIAGETDGLQPAEKTTTLDGRTVALGDFSHALLGILDAIASPAALALRRLAAGDRTGYDAIMAPCEELGRKIFEAPTRHYKTGLAFLAWLNGLQDNPMLVNHEEHARSREHLLDVVECANRAGAILDAPTAADRLAGWLAATS
ncbi:MAG: dihydrodipicolinate synthase family protein, partial [Phycisphaerales bacterium]|nr:dihydrodipicolinate synthase family protein [Phycisphaerales bacterium]